MKFLCRFLFCTSAAAALLLTSCGTMTSISSGNYHVTAHRPSDPSRVRVKVSLSKQNVYVMEGDRCLMAAATTVGIPAKPTPKGSFTIYSKQPEQCPGSFEVRCQGARLIPADAGRSSPVRVVGYPIGLWVQFSPGYGLHQGYVHLRPRSHGCLRLKGEAAPKFFALVRTGTPVNIAESQPEDATIGPKIQRVDDSKTPDPPMRVSISASAFQKPSGSLLED